ncbi:tRNA dihydrouridine synthase DusB [Nakamurella sp. DB0629]|uniref:tRNA dihydrouridine synthase DusB n=2 Tax=Nakamurella aerolata TaxID=1656892 RepID=A0A849A8U0_9ACTN|nr:tRNA dihydrouridine synthase DusB [Nakamurella aerolata]NNG35518.1 tRNA dihydrouridine synthase DusB [Nakamurella aerolata]
MTSTLPAPAAPAAPVGDAAPGGTAAGGTAAAGAGGTVRVGTDRPAGAVADPMTIGRYQVWPPVELAPMAGITNRSFRKLCREFGAGLYVCEMVTTMALVERNPKTMDMVRFGPQESPRSLQLYGVDPDVVRRSVELIVEDDLADHIDLNFGCPVPKVTRRGGGSALPYKRKLFESIVSQAVTAAAPANIPVTVKMRIGIDPEHITYLDAGRIAEGCGAAAVALHGRTALQHYSGTADWSAIARLKETVTSVPVLGNGDIFSAQDALNMMARTGCDGVVVGRGCQGRPWLFAELAAAFDGRPSPTPPTLREVAAIMRRHAELLCEELGPARGIRDLRKHISWYLRGFVVGSTARLDLGMVDSLDDLDRMIDQLDLTQPYPTDAEGPRGRAGSPQSKVALPHGWLTDPDELAVPEGAEIGTSGG